MVVMLGVVLTERKETRNEVPQNEKNTDLNKGVIKL